MNNDIKVIELNHESVSTIILNIQGCEDRREAFMAAEEWCDENNRVIIGRPFKNEQLSRDGQLVLSVKVGSDDYK